ncbi:MAG TPA: hypothetical protein VMX97_11110, partial [Hyphomicrobiaceae bacterium]|nr:hypothetical protein [Hyphomicrobiaceae bacterium]
MSWSLLDQLLVSAANFAIGIMVARYAGIAEFGKFTLVLVLLLYVAIVLDMILAMPMMTLAGARQHRSAAYFAAITAWNIILAVGVGAVVAALTCTLFWLRDGTVPWLLVFAAFAVTAAHNQLHIVRRTLFALDRGRSALIVGVLRYFLLFAAAAVLYFQGANTNAETALLLLAGSAFVTSIIPTVKLLRGGVRLRMMRAIWSRQWPMARWMLLMAAVSTGQEQLIWVMVSVMLGDAAVGGMRAAQHLLGTTHFVLNGMQNFVARQSAQAYRQSGAEGLMAYLIGR